MEREELINRVNGLLKLIRTEYGLTQDKMALILGISKKTLVESEKGRRRLGWTEVVTLSTIFSGSQVLQNAFGGEISDIIAAVAFQEVDVHYPNTMGGKVWCRDIREQQGYWIQQNIISQHYRLLNEQDQRILSSFDRGVVEEHLAMLCAGRGI
jgi:DNA-binding XRE family transcriptional regulator